MKKIILILISIFALSCSNDTPAIPTVPTCQTYEVVYKKTIQPTLAGTTNTYNSNAVAWVQFSKTEYSKNCSDKGKILATSSEFYGTILVMRKTVVE